MTTPLPSLELRREQLIVAIAEHYTRALEVARNDGLSPIRRAMIAEREILQGEVLSAELRLYRLELHTRARTLGFTVREAVVARLGGHPAELEPCENAARPTKPPPRRRRRRAAS